MLHGDVIKWKHFPHYWPFVRGIHWWPLDFPHKGLWCGALMFFFDLYLSKRLRKQLHSLWRHCNVSSLTSAWGGFHTIRVAKTWCDDLFVSMEESIRVVVFVPSVTGGRHAVHKVSQYRDCHGIAISHYISSECKPHAKQTDSSCNCPSITGQELSIMFRQTR